MLDQSIEWYLDFIKREVKVLKDGKFTGNLDLKLNMKEGGICNMNCGRHKSVKMPGR